MHPTLYKRTSTGAIQTWRIDVEGSTLIATYGQLGGALQRTNDTITEGKNVGRSNETTPAQQAQLEAASQWEKKVKKGYVQTVEEAQSGAVDAAFVTGGADPMLAHSFAKQGHKIRFPAFVQPKLDGHRCIAIVKDGEATLWSRTRKPITGLPHIVSALRGLPDTVLDGELYNHAYRDKFEQLTSFIKRAEPKPGHEVVEYHVYDTISEGPFVERSQVRNFHLIGLAAFACIQPVATVQVHDADEAMDAFAMFTEQGYEGAMIRNAASPYVGKRSYDLQKMKEFDDAEFEIVGVEEGRGRMAGRGIFVCRTKAGAEFRVKMKGALDTLDVYLAMPEYVIGRQLTVQFQGYTNDNEVPRFPIGLRFAVAV